MVAIKRLGVVAASMIIIAATASYSAEIYENSQYGFDTGRFQIKGTKMFMIGRLNDQSPWDHIDSPGKTVHPVEGEIVIDVDALQKNGSVVATARTDEGRIRIVYTKFYGWSSYQDGGIIDRLYEHGDSGHGDTMYPKTWLYLAGFGDVDVFLNDALIKRGAQSHFMVTEGIRDEHNMIHYPNSHRKGPGGDVDPSKMQIHMWVKWGKENDRNYPPVEHFWNSFWKEVTWQG